MKCVAFYLCALALATAGFSTQRSAVWAQQSPSPLERYRKLEFPPVYENFDRGWQERVALEFEIVIAFEALCWTARSTAPPARPTSKTTANSSIAVSR